MNAVRIVAFILAGILIFFGVLFIWAAFGSVFNPGWFFTGIVTIGIGFGLIIAAVMIGKRISAQAAANENVTLKIDLPANVSADAMKCKSCGGSLTMENITMVAGAPVVNCPYCGTTYQLTEAPKW